MRAVRWMAWSTLAFATCVAADVKVELVEQGECPPPFRVLELSGSQLRVDQDAGNSMIFDGLEETAIHLDHGGGRWMAIEVDADAADYTGDVATSAMHRMDRELEKAQKQMQESCRRSGMECPQMAAMDMQAMMQMAQGMAQQAQAGGAQGSSARPGELAAPGMDAQAMQAMMAQMQGAAAPAPAPAPAPPAPRFVDTGRDEVLAAGRCRWHEERLGDVVLQAQCVASPDAVALEERDRRGMQNAMRTLQRYAGALQPFQSAFGIAAPEAPPSRDGLLLAQRCYDARGQERGQVEARLAQQAIDASRFEVPAGYGRFEAGAQGR